MSDKASSGEPFKVPHSWNDMVDAGQHYAQRKRLGLAAWHPKSQPNSRGIIHVKNESGQDCEVGDILAVGGVVVDAVDYDDSGVNLLHWMNNVVWSGTLPDIATDVGRFAVLLDPIVDDGFGLAVVDGIVAAKIDIDSAYHLYADIADDSVRLTSNWYGSAEILYKEQISSDWYAIVRMGPFAAPSYPGKVNSSLSYEGSAQVSIWEYDSGWSDTGEDVSVVYDWLLASGQSIASGKKVDIQFNQLSNVWRVLNAECA